MDLIKVSVICLAYNHAKYIRDTLEGFVSQETDFPFEVIVHDDASADGTDEIIREYQAKYPDIIKPIFQKENQYSKGVPITKEFIFPILRGEYIAFCEGDDYWTDSRKLQGQVDALDAHPEVDICAHTVEIIRASNNEFIRFLKPESTDQIIPARNVILGGGDFVGTNSLFYRKNLDLYQPEFRKICRYDYALQVHGALRGGMLYLADCMSVYRYMTIGSWSATVPFDEEKETERNQLWEKMLRLLDEETEGKYTKEIKLYSEDRVINFHYRFRHYAELKRYRDTYKRFEGKARTKQYLLTHFPWLYIHAGDAKKALQRKKKTG